MERIIFLSIALIFFARLGFSGEKEIIESLQKNIGDFGSYLSDEHCIALIQQSLKQNADQGKSYSAEYDYIHSYVTVKKDGTSSEYLDYAVKINSPYAKREFGEQKFYFDESRQKVDILKASCFLAPDKEIKTDPSNILIKEPYTGLIYEELKMKILHIQGIENGSAFRVVLLKNYTPTEEKGFFYNGFYFQGNYPIKEELCVIHFKAGVSFRQKSNFKNNLNGMIEKKMMLNNGDEIYLYFDTNLKPRSHELKSVSPWEFGSSTIFYSMSSWDEVAKWYYQISNASMIANDELKSKVKELTKDLSDKESKTKALFDYVKNLRYVGIELNQHGFRPHQAAETFNNKYGDCKDKSTLLITMLREAGIKAYITLITTYKLIDKEIATPLNFNHAITAVLNEDGSYKFIDPTNEILRYGFLPSVDQHRYALVVKENGGDLALTPTDSVDKNKYETMVEMNITDLTKAEISEKEILAGGYEYRRVDALKYPEERLINDLKENLSKKYKNVEIDSLKYENLNGEGELICNKLYKIEDVRKLAGELNSFNPLESSKIIEDGNIIARETRSTEIEFPSPWKWSATVTIKIPDTLSVEYLPKTMLLQNDKFGEYNYIVDNNGSTIKINRTFIFNKKRVSVNDYKEFKEFYQKCIDYDNQNILIKSKLRN